MHRITAGGASYLISANGVLTMPEDTTTIRESHAALSVLRLSVGDGYAMRELRLLLAELRHADVNHLSDVQVAETLAGLVAAGRVFLSVPTNLVKSRLKIGSAPAAAEAPARAASPTPRSAPAERVEPSFMADVDAALLAATLKDASKDGVPFCEECARAARAA